MLQNNCLSCSMTISCVLSVFQALQCDEWPDGEPPLDAEVDLWDDCRMDVSYIFMDQPMIFVCLI